MPDLELYRKFLLTEAMVDTSYTATLPPCLLCGPSRVWVLSRPPETVKERAVTLAAMAASYETMRAAMRAQGLEVF